MNAYFYIDYEHDKRWEAEIICSGCPHDEDCPYHKPRTWACKEWREKHE